MPKLRSGVKKHWCRHRSRVACAFACLDSKYIGASALVPAVELGGAQGAGGEDMPRCRPRDPLGTRLQAKDYGASSESRANPPQHTSCPNLAGDILRVDARGSVKHFPVGCAGGAVRAPGMALRCRRQGIRLLRGCRLTGHRPHFGSANMGRKIAQFGAGKMLKRTLNPKP